MNRFITNIVKELATVLQVGLATSLLLSIAQPFLSETSSANEGDYLKGINYGLQNGVYVSDAGLVLEIRKSETRTCVQMNTNIEDGVTAIGTWSMNPYFLPESGQIDGDIYTINIHMTDSKTVRMEQSHNTKDDVKSDYFYKIASIDGFAKKGPEAHAELDKCLASYVGRDFHSNVQSTFSKVERGF